MIPPLPRESPPAEVNGAEIVITLGDQGDRRYRVRGLEKNLGFDAMKVNVLASRGDAFHVDTLDLYAARNRKLFISEVARELGADENTIKTDLGRVLLKLEELQEAQVNEALKPKDKTPAMNDAERAAALSLLQSPDLLDRILADFERCGVVGEATNKLTGYLAATSRKLEQPLAVVVQSSSAAGKSSLMEAVLAMLPPEEVTKFSAMTGQSLFYMQESDLKHKVLAIVEEEGAERASYALKLLQSEGELTIASTGKDPQTGRLVTQEYRVEGPVMIFLTTTAAEIDEELLNRCLVLSVNEEREQTRAIHIMQRRRQTLSGLLEHRDRAAVLKLHRDAQRLIKPMLVANPFAEKLTFLDARTRSRRDHVKYLTLIRTVALLHQYQRPHQTIEHPPASGQFMEYIEVTPVDVAIANKLTHEVLGRSLDELAPQTRRLLVMLDAHVSDDCKRLKMLRSDYRFTRRDVRRHVGWSDFQVRTHLQKLVDLEYVLTHRGGRGQSFVYELVYGGEGTDGKPFTLGLIDTQTLNPPVNHAYDKKFEHQKGEFEHGSSIQSAPIAVGSCAPQSAESPGNHRSKPASSSQRVEIMAQAGTSDESYRNGTSYPLPPLAASSNGNGKAVHHGA